MPHTKHAYLKYSDAFVQVEYLLYKIVFSYTCLLNTLEFHGRTLIVLVKIHSQANREHHPANLTCSATYNSC